MNGFNFGENNNDLTDSNGHGTHVAGIVAASGVHMVSGVAPRAKIMCLKVQDSDGALFASYILQAYQVCSSTLQAIVRSGPMHCLYRIVVRWQEEEAAAKNVDALC